MVVFVFPVFFFHRGISFSSSHILITERICPFPACNSIFLCVEAFSFTVAFFRGVNYAKDSHDSIMLFKIMGYGRVRRRRFFMYSFPTFSSRFLSHSFPPGVRGPRMVNIKSTGAPACTASLVNSLESPM